MTDVSLRRTLGIAFAVMIVCSAIGCGDPSESLASQNLASGQGPTENRVKVTNVAVMVAGPAGLSVVLPAGCKVVTAKRFEEYDKPGLRTD